MKPKSKVWMYGVVLACVIVIVAILSLGCLQKESEVTMPPTPVTDKEEPAMVMIPEELVIYYDYLGVIGGKPRISDIGTIEATIISITKNEVCPDEIESVAPEPTDCSIEPYPKDTGIVRIDKIINYTPYSEQPVEHLEQSSPSGEEPSETALGYNGNGYRGEDLPKPKLPEYEPLQEGQEVSTHFLLTAGPAKVRYAPIPEPQPSPHGPMESAQSKDIISEQNRSHKSESEEKIFKPIPKDGNYYVFTTKYGFPETIEKILPGLQVGSKFRAEIWYDGSLYIEEYEVVT